jgi:hypothetical protein
MQKGSKSSSKLAPYSILGLKKSQMNKTWPKKKTYVEKINCVDYQ